VAFRDLHQFGRLVGFVVGIDGRAHRLFILASLRFSPANCRIQALSAPSKVTMRRQVPSGVSIRFRPVEASIEVRTPCGRAISKSDARYADDAVLHCKSRGALRRLRGQARSFALYKGYKTCLKPCNRSYIAVLPSQPSQQCKQ
jgi:hypothetical protein